MERHLTIGGKERELRFPSLIQAKKVGDVLGFDPLRETNFAKLDWVAIIEDKPRLLKAFELVLVGEVKESILDDLTLGDCLRIFTAFFFLMSQTSIQFKNGLEFLNGISAPEGPNPSQEATVSTSPSTVSQKAGQAK